MSNQTTEPSGEALIDSRAFSGTDDGGWAKWRALTADAYARFHENLLTNRPIFPGLADYVALERIDASSGTFACKWGVVGELQETINSVNAWGIHLHEWGAWNSVIDSYESDGDKWEVLHHFVDPVVYFCMHQPSSLLDRLMVASETVLHQANRLAFTNEPDRLAQDDLQPGKTLRRTDRRKQLNRLGKHWDKFGALRDALCEIDGADYKAITRDFRNLSAHAFPPRIMFGQVFRALRSIAPWQEMVARSEGTYMLIPHPTKRVVRYEMHAIEPLTLDAMHSANLAQYEKALIAMRAFAELIDELCNRKAPSQRTNPRHRGLV